MTEAQWRELEQLMAEFFSEFDVNKTGSLGIEGVTAILKSVGLRCSTEEAREMMSQVAGPSKVTITREELMQILRTHTHQEDEEHTLEQAFRLIDVDGDGSISAEDLQCFMQSLGEDFDLKYAERMLKAATAYRNPGPGQVNVTLEDYKQTLRGKWANAPTST
jgi:calmodulin